MRLEDLSWSDWLLLVLGLMALWKGFCAVRETGRRAAHPPNEVNQFRVYLRVAETWCNTAVAVFAIAALFAVVMLFVGRMLGPRALIALIRSALVTTALAFILSEMIIVILTKADRVHKDPRKEQDYPRFSAAVERLFQRNGWLMKRPRLYVGHFLGMPNAVAFGWGILGQYAVMISKELYELLDDDELEGVVAHEIAHIRHLDVGLLTVVSILTGLCKTFINSLGHVRTPGAVVLVIALKALDRLIFPIGVSTIQCEREYSADALGALYKGEGASLKSALQKLHKAIEPHLKEMEESSSPVVQILRPLTPSHPGMENRFGSLDKLRKGEC